MLAYKSMCKETFSINLSVKFMLSKLETHALEMNNLNQVYIILKYVN